MWIAQGRLSEALGWASDQKLSAADDLCYLHEFEHITLAQAAPRLLYKREHDDQLMREAVGLLERLLKAAGR